MDLMEHIDEELKKRHWTRNELATRAGLSGAYFPLLAKGVRAMGADAAGKIARALDLPVEVIYEWAGLLETKKGENPLIRELGIVAEELNDDKIYILIDIARGLKERDKPAPARSRRPNNA